MTTETMLNAIAKTRAQEAENHPTNKQRHAEMFALLTEHLKHLQQAQVSARDLNRPGSYALADLMDLSFVDTPLDRIRHRVSAVKSQYEKLKEFAIKDNRKSVSTITIDVESGKVEVSLITDLNEGKQEIIMTVIEDKQ